MDQNMYVSFVQRVDPKSGEWWETSMVKEVVFFWVADQFTGCYAEHMNHQEVNESNMCDRVDQLPLFPYNRG